MKPAPLNLRTLALRRVFHDGTTSVAPLAEPRHAVTAAEDVALVELEAFLSTYLAGAPPHLLARYAFPPDTELVEVDVSLKPPGRDPLPVQVRLAVVVIPHGRARWVVLPALDHTFHIDRTESLPDVVAHEAQRVVTAYTIDGRAFLDLLPPRVTELCPLDVVVGADDTQSEQALERVRARQTLASVGDLLTTVDARALVGRDDTRRTLDGLLSGTDRLSVLLVGPAGAGKSALLFDWLRRADPAPAVYATSGARLVAGADGYGEWQERLRAVARAAALTDSVLYFPNLADLLTDGRAGSFDPTTTLKPFLTERRLRLVGELDPEAAERLGNRAAGFFGCLTRVSVDALTAPQTVAALQARRDPTLPHLDDAAIEAVVGLGERYLPYEAFPGKAVRLRDELATTHAHERRPDGTHIPVDATRAYAAFARRTGLPEVLLQPTGALRPERITAAIQRRLIGQDDAVRRVVEVLCTVKAGLQPAEKPLATLLFVGPTGVGKTELARALAEWLFGDPRRLVRFDMSEYADPWAAERLIRGSDREEGLLTRQVRRQPFGVVLLDEIEKADPAVFDLLLQVAGEGRLTDARGQTAWFRNTLLVMTSNLGAAHRRTTIGIDPVTVDEAAHYRSTVEKHFRPEFTNRIDAIVPFTALDPEQVGAITALVLGRIQGRSGFVDTGATIEVTDAARAALAAGGYHPAYGARALRRHLEDEVVAPMARVLCELGGGAAGATLRLRTPAERAAAADAEHAAGALALDVRRGRSGEQRWPAHHVGAVLNLRRMVAREIHHGPVAGALEALELTRQLLRADPGAEGLLKQARELSGLWDEAQGLLRQFEDAEELALHALAEGEDTEAIRDEAVAVHDGWPRVHVHLSVATLPGRDGVTLLVQEVDALRALDHWLPPLLAALRPRGWALEIHRQGADRGRSEGWPPARRWGPPQDPGSVRTALSDPERDPVALILRLRGSYAGALAGLEEGVVCFELKGGRTAHLYVRLISLGTQLPEAAWGHEAFEPLLPTDWEAQTKAESVRYIDLPAQDVYVDGDPLGLAPADYWHRYERIAFEDLWGETAVLDWYEQSWRPTAADVKGG